MAFRHREQLEHKLKDKSGHGVNQNQPLGSPWLFQGRAESAAA